MTTAMDRFRSKVLVQPDGCLIWTAGRHRDGYGSFWADGRNWPAHRWYFEQVEGPVDNRLVLDHLCRVRACVNPAHLRAVTDRENLFAPGSLALAKANASLTHCARGHRYRDEVLEPRRRAKGLRWCRACANAVWFADKRRRRTGIALTEAEIQAYADRKYAEYMAASREVLS